MVLDIKPSLIHQSLVKAIEAAEGEAITLDYAATGLTLRRHPMALLRPRLAQRG